MDVLVDTVSDDTVDVEVTFQRVLLDGVGDGATAGIRQMLNGSTVETDRKREGVPGAVEVLIQNQVHPFALYFEGVEAKFKVDVMIVKSTGKGADFFKDDLVSFGRVRGEE